MHIYIYIYIYIYTYVNIYRDTISTSFSERLMDISKSIEREKQGFKGTCKYMRMINTQN
jgi:hypothetical protein